MTLNRRWLDSTNAGSTSLRWISDVLVLNQCCVRWYYVCPRILRICLYTAYNYFEGLLQDRILAYQWTRDVVHTLRAFGQSCVDVVCASFTGYLALGQLWLSAIASSQRWSSVESFVFPSIFCVFLLVEVMMIYAGFRILSTVSYFSSVEGWSRISFHNSPQIYVLWSFIGAVLARRF